MCMNAIQFMASISSNAGTVWLEFGLVLLPVSVLVEIYTQRISRLSLEAFSHPEYQQITQISLSAQWPVNTVTSGLQSWNFILYFNRKAWGGEYASHNTMPNSVPNAGKIHCACSYISIVNNRVINLSSPQKLVVHVLMCFCMKFNCSDL